MYQHLIEFELREEGAWENTTGRRSLWKYQTKFRKAFAGEYILHCENEVNINFTNWWNEMMESI